MAKGRNANREGARSNELYQLQALNRIVGAITGGGIPSPTGLATETTLAALLAATVAGAGQEIEILLVRDTVTLEVFQQITDYTTGVPLIIYKDVNGVVQSQPLPNPIEYLDPAAVMSLVLAAIQAQGVVPQATEATLLLLEAKLNSLGQKASADSAPVVLSTEQEAILATIDSVLDAIKLDTANISADQATNTTLTATNALLTTIDGVLDAIKLDTANLTPSLRVPLLQRLGLPAAVDSGNIAAGKRSVSFLNAGSLDITIATGTLKPGESITFNAGGQGDTLGPIPYSLPATADCVVTSIT
jgi:hypothetical protein